MKNYSSKTKESYLHNSKATGIRKHVLWVVVAFLVLFLVKDLFGSITAPLTMPFYAVRHYLETSSEAVPVFLRDRLTLLTHIRELEERLSTQHDTEASLAFLTIENKELRGLLEATTTPRILAGVIARPPHTPYDSIIIDRGSEDGILENAPVYLGGESAIGYVRTVFSTTALVVLFSSPGVESTVFVFGPNLFTTAYGEGGGIIRLSIPQGIEAREGDVVILPSLDTGVVGTIHDLVSNPTEPEQKAYVSPDVSLQSLRLVSVGTTPVRPASFEEAIDVVHKEEQRLFLIEVPPDVVMDVSSTTQQMLHPKTETSTMATSTVL